MKAFKWMVIVIVVLIAAIVGYVVLNSGALAKQGIETYGTEFLGAKVNVDRVELSLADGAGTIRSLDIGQPAGFDGDSAVRVDSIALVLNTAESTADLLVIDRITVDGARINAIARSAEDNNFRALLDNLQRTTGMAQSESSSQKLIIRRFEFTNAIANAALPLTAKSVELSIPDVHLTDIGDATAGATPDQVARLIMVPVTKAVMRAVSESISASVVKGASDAQRDRLGGSLDKLRQLGHPTD